MRASAGPLPLHAARFKEVPQPWNVLLIDVDQQMINGGTAQLVGDGFGIGPADAAMGNHPSAGFGLSRPQPPGAREAPLCRVAKLQDDGIVALGQALQDGQRLGLVQIAEHNQ